MKTILDKETETKTPKPTADNSPGQIPNIAGATTHNSITRPPLTEPQAILQVDQNSIHTTSRKAVKKSVQRHCSVCLGNECPCTGILALRVHCQGRSSKNCVPRLPSHYRIIVCLCPGMFSLGVQHRGNSLQNCVLR